MFGSKQDKVERLAQEVEILMAEGELSVAQLAKRVGVPRKTIYSDLVALHDQGIRLQEDEGKISIYQEY